MKKMMTGVLALVLVLVMVGCGQKDNGVVNGVAKDGATIGEGAKSFTMEVVDKDGGKVTFTVKTDADTVGKALLVRVLLPVRTAAMGCTSRPSTVPRWTMTPTGCTGPSISTASTPRPAWTPPV